MLMDVILLGAGGQARDMIKNIEEYNADLPKGKRLNIVGCLDDTPGKKNGRSVADYPVLDSMKIFGKRPYAAARVICAVGDPVNKRIFARKAGEYNLKFFNIIHPSVPIHRSCNLGTGISIFASSVISAFCNIGDHVAINYLVSVNHDCRLGDYATLAPGVRMGGSCVVGEGSFLGINSCLINDVEIGEWSIVGAGTTVIGNVPACSVAAGNPQKILRKREKNTPFI